MRFLIVGKDNFIYKEMISYGIKLYEKEIGIVFIK
jgi:hypothetical protein